MQILSDGKGIHRINVTDETEKVKAVLSQSTLIHYLASHKQVLGSIGEKTIKELGIVQCPAVSVSDTTPVVDALEKMSEFGISSIAVVDSGKHIVGNISMADIKYIFKHGHYSKLWTTASNFVSLVLRQQGLENDGKDRFPVFECTEDATLLSVIQKIVATHVHRIWIVDEHREIKGVVSLTDIIRLCLHEASAFKK